MTTATFHPNPNPPSISALLKALERAGFDPDTMPWSPESIDLATALLEQEIEWQNLTVLEYEALEAEEFIEMRVTAAIAVFEASHEGELAAKSLHGPTARLWAELQAALLLCQKAREEEQR